MPPSSVRGRASSCGISGSLNGTYVGKDRVDEVRLQPGQDVQIGKYRLTYHPFHGTA